LVSDVENKYRRVKEILGGMRGVVVAFSGGVDSSLLLACAREALGDNVLAVTSVSATFPASEYDVASRVAADMGVNHQVIVTDELTDPAFRKNPVDRCYYCKKHLFSVLKEKAKERGGWEVVEGSNSDDLGDYRPGLKAVEQLGVRSPFIEAGLRKEEIRLLAREKNLMVWDKPSQACLASRIPYGEEITEERLKRIDAAENALRSLGFALVRVRDWRELAVVELGRDDMERAFRPETRNAVINSLKRAGYRRVTLDLEGYRTGSLNESLAGRDK